MNNIKFSSCLRKMLHIVLRRTISSSQAVYMNVTHHYMNNIKFSQIVYVNVTHHYMNNIKFSSCLRKMLHIVLRRTISSSQAVYMNVTHHYMNNIKFSQIVYVNVTHHYMNNIKFSSCLCKCYTSFCEQYQVLKLFM
jgi:hypothetical protein